MNSAAASTAEQHSSWGWWATGVIAVAAFGFGFAGMLKYELAAHPAGGVDYLSLIYHTLQLFILHGPHLDQPVPWQLHVGRLLGAIPLCVAAVMAFLKVFPDEWNLMMLRLPWTRGHVVICGLGDIGLRLALEGRRRKKRIVAIEKTCLLETRRLMRDQGVLVLDGDASDEAQLRAAQVDRAEFVVASCRDDSTNAAIAAKVGRIVAPNRGRKPLICRTLIGNPDIRRVLSESPLLSARLPEYRVNFSDLDQHALAARQAFSFHPVDLKPIREDDETIVRLVVIGFGLAGQSLALQGARIGHFANETGKGMRLLITVVEPSEAAVAEFKAGFPNFHLVCDLEPPITQPQTAAKLAALCERNMQVTYAFCWEDQAGDERNFTFGMDLLKHLNCPAAQVLIRQSTRNGFAALWSGADTLVADGRIHAFGMVEDVFSWDVLLRESQDMLARELHEAYRVLYPAAKEWDDLGEEFRDSNRQAADHIPVKLRALGYHLEKATMPGRILGFQKEEIELLAKMEHARFCGERWLAGWTCGPETIRERKINRTLVKWDDLPPEERKKDHGQINAIPGALYRMGLGIYR